MNNFGELRRIPLREMWQHEANDFTPWLAENIEALGEALGLDLELTSREAPVGDFSLDLLARDLNSSRTVIIENQFSQTDHNHLGKLVTYAAGFDASMVIWLAEEVRDEHRQALEWINQKTGTDTQFFGVVVEILTIDNSRPAYNFKPVVLPNEWQKSRRQDILTSTSPREERYKGYFQSLKDELIERDIFTGGHFSGASSRRYFFPPGIRGVSGNPQIKYQAAFPGNDEVPTVAACLYIEGDRSNVFFDALATHKEEINRNFGTELEWERRDGVNISNISIYRGGDIESSNSELEEIRQWHIENLLKLKEVFTPEIERALATIDNAEL